MVMSAANAINRLNAACERVHGQACTLAGSPITGIYRAPYAAAFGVADIDPTFRTRTQNLPTPPNGLELIVPGSGTFKVRSHQPDGTGWSTLQLEAP